MSCAAGAAQAGIEIGGISIRVRTEDETFLRILQHRYGGFLSDERPPDFEFDVELTNAPIGDPDDDVRVYRDGEQWHLERGDFRAQWNPRARRGHIRQSANPYAIDSVLRIVHSLVLAREGGLLVHAASVVLGGRAFLFAGKSGAGKTTIAGLAPADAHVLSDEVSYVRREQGRFFAYGTPFAGELARAGENMRAPLEGVFLLGHGATNRIDPVLPQEAARDMLGNVLFFAHDPELVRAVFDGTLELVERVPVRRLTFVPDEHVWELIR